MMKVTTIAWVLYSISYYWMSGCNLCLVSYRVHRINTDSHKSRPLTAKRVHNLILAQVDFTMIN